MSVVSVTRLSATVFAPAPKTLFLVGKKKRSYHVPKVTKTFNEAIIPTVKYANNDADTEHVMMKESYYNQFEVCDMDNEIYAPENIPTTGNVGVIPKTSMLNSRIVENMMNFLTWLYVLWKQFNLRQLMFNNVNIN